MTTTKILGKEIKGIVFYDNRTAKVFFSDGKEEMILFVFKHVEINHRVDTFQRELTLDLQLRMNI